MPSELRKSLPRVTLANGLSSVNALVRPGHTQQVFNKFGDRFRYSFPGFPEIVVTRVPEDLRQVFRDEDKAWSWGEFLKRFSPHDVLFGDSYIFFDHTRHAQERRLISAPFNGRALKSYEQKMVDIVDRRIGQWPTGEPISFFALSHRLASDVMSSVVFGVTDQRRLEQLDRALANYFGILNGVVFESLAAVGLLTGGRIPRHPQLSSAERAIDQIVLAEIAARRRNGTIDDGDMVGRYLAEPNGSFSARDDEALAASARRLMFAGYETTAATLSWVGVFLSRHPDVVEELEASVDRGEERFLDAVVNEAMRMRPAIPLTGRRAVRDTTLGDVPIRKGTALLVPILGMHESPGIHHDPFVFRPQRFIDEQPSSTSLLPFGGGVNKCLGAPFAQFELRVLLRTFLAQRSFVPQSTRVPHPRVRTEMMVPRDGAMLTLRKRVRQPSV